MGPVKVTLAVPSIETEARLDLIQIAANVVNAEDKTIRGEDDDQLLDLIEALCRYRNVPIEGVLNGVHMEILMARSEDEIRRFLVEHKVTPPPAA